MTSRSATRTIAIAALLITGIPLAGCSGGAADAGEPAVDVSTIADGAYGSLSDSRDYLYVEDGVVTEVRSASFAKRGDYVEMAQEAREATLTDLRNGEIRTDDIPELTATSTSTGMCERPIDECDPNYDWEIGESGFPEATSTTLETKPIYAVGAVGEIHDDGTGIIWDGDISDIVKLQIDVPVKGTFTLGSVIYAEIDSDEYKNG